MRCLNQSQLPTPSLQFLKMGHGRAVTQQHRPLRIHTQIFAATCQWQHPIWRQYSDGWVILLPFFFFAGFGCSLNIKFKNWSHQFLNYYTDPYDFAGTSTLLINAQLEIQMLIITWNALFLVSSSPSLDRAEKTHFKFNQKKQTSLELWNSSTKKRPMCFKNCTKKILNIIFSF